MTDPVYSSKIQLRKEMRALRDRLDPQARQIHSRQIAVKVLAQADVLQAERIFIYVSFRSEVDTRELIERLIQQGKEVFVPVICVADRMQMARFVGWKNMRPDSFGVLVPNPPLIERGNIDTAIVPGLAFSSDGARIGYGKGHYDRFFSQHVVETKIGIAFDCQIVDEIPTGALDCPMDWVISESRMLNAPS